MKCWNNFGLIMSMCKSKHKGQQVCCVSLKWQKLVSLLSSLMIYSIRKLKKDKFCSGMQLILLKGCFPCLTFDRRWNTFVKCAFIALTSGKLNWQKKNLNLFAAVYENKLKVKPGEKNHKPFLNSWFYLFIYFFTSVNSIRGIYVLQLVLAEECCFLSLHVSLFSWITKRTKAHIQKTGVARSKLYVL